MKTFLIALSLMAFAFVSFGTAQSVIITPQRVVYKRPKPIMDFKTTFTVRYPKVKASTRLLSRKIESTISYAKLLELNVQEEIKDIQWLEEADYEVGYNKNGILSISLSMNGTGAYPSGSSKTVVVDLKTGNRVRPTDVFRNLDGLTAIISKAQKAEILKAAKGIKEDPENRDVDTGQLFENANFKRANLAEFAVSATGVTFIYDYGFPHVIQAVEPDGSYFFTWRQLEPFIKRGGLLARFIR